MMVGMVTVYIYTGAPLGLSIYHGTLSFDTTKRSCY